MFGLMKAQTCSLSDEFKVHRRLHYCGTCKTLGGLYGHPSRVLLNHDTVFLAEVLSAISSTSANLKTWQHSYQSFNCLSLPRVKDAMPLALQIAATATVVLAEFKIADHLTDTKHFIWKMARKIFANDFRKARALLRSWQFPFDELQKVLRSQELREASATMSTHPAPDILNEVAEPTAIATAMFCRHGARLVGRRDIEPALYEFGYLFGKLIYLLDAFEDYEKDRRRGEFNAIRAAYRVTNSELPGVHSATPIFDFKMPAEVRSEMTREIRALAGQLQLAIDALPLPATFAEMFSARLRANLAKKIGALPVLGHASRAKAQVCESRLTLAERMRRAIEFSRKITGFDQAEPAATLGSSLAARFGFIAVLPIAFFNPQQARTATSYRDCLSLGLNLIFFGAVINTAGAIVNSLILTVGNRLTSVTPPNLPGEQPISRLNEAANQLAATRRPRNPQGGGCCTDCLGGCGEGCCDSGCDCGCDCCCDNCDCCSCDCN